MTKMANLSKLIISINYYLGMKGRILNMAVTIRAMINEKISLMIRSYLMNHLSQVRKQSRM